jgi:hypothetical protein
VDKKTPKLEAFSVDLKRTVINNCCWKFAAYLPSGRPVRRSCQEHCGSPLLGLVTDRPARTESPWI